MPRDSHWSEEPEAIPTGAGDCREPAVVAAGELLHVAWTQGRSLNHICLAEGKWSEPRQIAMGGQAALAAGPDGIIHCLFSAQMFGNVEIYYAAWNDAKWTLPELVSRTKGVSIYPALAVGTDGSLHATWADTTPGHAVIYYGRRERSGWKSKPVPNGSGSHPAIAIDRDGEIYLAWQSRLAETDRFEIFCAIGYGGNWDLPANVSDNGQRHSICPSLTVSQQGACHLVWQEDLGEVFGIRHADRLPNGWSEAATVSESGADCRLPRICSGRQNYPQVAWAEGQVVTHRVRPAERNAAWWQSEAACGPHGAVSELAAALSANGELHVVWAAYTEGDTRRLRHARREPVFKPAVFMPIAAQAEEQEQPS